MPAILILIFIDAENGSIPRVAICWRSRPGMLCFIIVTLLLCRYADAAGFSRLFIFFDTPLDADAATPLDYCYMPTC